MLIDAAANTWQALYALEASQQKSKSHCFDDVAALPHCPAAATAGAHVAAAEAVAAQHHTRSVTRLRGRSCDLADHHHGGEIES